MTDLGFTSKDLIAAGMFSKNPKELVTIGTAMAIGNVILGKIIEQYPRWEEGHFGYSVREERNIKWAMKSTF